MKTAPAKLHTSAGAGASPSDRLERVRSALGSIARLRSAWMLAALAIAALCAGCGSGSSTGTHSTGTRASVLTIGETSAPTDVRPDGAADNARIDTLAYEGILSWSSSGQAAPGLAVSWRFLPSTPPNTTFEFTLRHDARFADGTPVTAQAVKTWFDFVTHHAKNPAAAAYLGAPAWVHTSGRWTVTFSLKKPNPLIPYALSNYNPGYGRVASPRCVAQPARLESGQCGAGPYMLGRQGTVTGSRYTYVPNPHYYDTSRQPWSKVVALVLATPSSMLQAMQTGQVDAAQGDASTVTAAKAAGLQVVAPPAINAGLFLNTAGASNPLRSLKVRQALNYGIDREQLAKSFGGVATDEVRTYGGYVEQYASYYSYDPAKAKALLAAAGYPHGITVKAVSCGPLGSQGTPLVQAEASQLAKVGITLDIQPATTQAAVNTAFGQRPPMIQAPFGVDFTSVYYNIFMAPGAYGGWSDPTIDSLMKRSLVSTPGTYAKYWQQISMRTVTQAYFLPSLTVPFYYFVNPKKVSNVQATAQNFLWFPANWKSAEAS